MKKILYILTAIILLGSCSAERRMARILYNHPELVEDTTMYIDTTIITPKQEDKKTFTIEDLQALRVDSTAPTTTNNSNQPDSTKIHISVATDGCSASITPNADGSFNLNLKQNPDTIVIHKPYPVKKIITKTITKDKIVYQMNGFQKTFFWIGIILTIMIVTGIILKAIS